MTVGTDIDSGRYFLPLNVTVSFSLRWRSDNFIHSPLTSDKVLIGSDFVPLLFLVYLTKDEYERQLWV